MSQKLICCGSRREFILGMGGDPGGGGGHAPHQYCGGGDGYGSVPPNNFPLSCTFYGSLAFTCTSTVCTRIHKEERTFSKISQDTQETPSTFFLAPAL